VCIRRPRRAARDLRTLPALPATVASVVARGNDGSLSTAEVGELLGLSRSTVSRRTRGKLAYRLTPGGHRRYSVEDVAAYLGRPISELEVAAAREAAKLRP